MKLVPLGLIFDDRPSDASNREAALVAPEIIELGHGLSAISVDVICRLTLSSN